MSYKDYIKSGDLIDTIEFDIPTFIRCLEYAREEIKSDDELHVFVEKLLENKGQTITMNLYVNAIKD